MFSLQEMMRMIYNKIIVSGRVQGVGFRYYTKRVAQQLGITGYVRNLPSGFQVEIVVLKDENWEEFLQRIKKGPAFSEVEKVEVITLEPSEVDMLELEKGFFEIRR